MICSRCGRPLPNKGVTCKFCGMLMSQEQIDYQNKMNDKHAQKLELLGEKYGRENKVEYRKEENKILRLAIIAVTLLILITIAIIINVMK